MTILVVFLALVAAASNATLAYVIRWLLAENKRLTAIVTAPSPAAAHVAALDRPARVRRDDDERPLRPVGA